MPNNVAYGPMPNGGNLDQYQGGGGSFANGAGYASGNPYAMAANAAIDLGTNLFGGGQDTPEQQDYQQMNMGTQIGNVNQNTNTQGGQSGQSVGGGFNNQQGTNFNNQSGVGSQSGMSGGSQSGFANSIGMTGQSGSGTGSQQTTGLTGQAGSNTGIQNTTGMQTTGGTGSQQNQLRGFDTQEQNVYNAIGNQLPGVYGNMTPEAQQAYAQDVQNRQRELGMQSVNDSFNRAAGAQQTAMARTGTGPGSIMASQAGALAKQRSAAANEVEQNAFTAGQNAANQRAAMNQGAAGIMGGQMVGMQGARQVTGTTNDFTNSTQNQQNTQNQQDFSNLTRNNQNTQNQNEFSNLARNTNQQNTGSANQAWNNQQNAFSNNQMGGFNNQGQTGQWDAFNNNNFQNTNMNQNSMNQNMDMTAFDSTSGGFQPNFFGNRADAWGPMQTAWGNNQQNPNTWATGGGIPANTNGNSGSAQGGTGSNALGWGNAGGYNPFGSGGSGGFAGQSGQPAYGPQGGNVGLAQGGPQQATFGGVTAPQGQGQAMFGGTQGGPQVRPQPPYGGPVQF